MVILSHEASTGHMISEHVLETTGDTLFLSRDGIMWYEVIHQNTDEEYLLTVKL